MNRNKQRNKWILVASILGMIVIVLLVIMSGRFQNSEKYKYTVIAEESAIEYPWEYLTLHEKIGSIDFENITYNAKSKEKINDTEIIEELIGTCKVSGRDENTNESFDEIVDVYSIKGISKELLVAVGIDEELYVYANANIHKPQILGELLEIYSLQEHINFDKFSICEGYEEKGFYKINDDLQIWEILSECEAVELEDTDGFLAEGSDNYLTFAITSEALGVYKQIIAISEEGYLDTNILEFGCTYYIGEEAALNIIQYAKENSVETEYEPYEQTIAGIITEIGERYVLIDDSSVCKNKRDGCVYKVFAEDIRVKRCIEVEGAQVGDVVIVSYRGNITDDKEILEAYSMNKGRLEGKNVLMEE